MDQTLRLEEDSRLLDVSVISILTYRSVALFMQVLQGLEDLPSFLGYKPAFVINDNPA